MKACLRLALFAAVAMLAAPVARAEKADRDKPVNLEADRVAVDELKRTQTFEGNVQLVKGTIVMRAARIVVTQDQGGFQHAVATGAPGGPLPHFRQKREGADEYVDGEAERIEYDARNEQAEFFNRAWIRSGLDEVRGQFISYDAKTEKYLVTSGPNGTRAQAGSGERVRAVIQPKHAAPTTPARPAGATPGLKPAQDIANPRPQTAE